MFYSELINRLHTPAVGRPLYASRTTGPFYDNLIIDIADHESFEDNDLEEKQKSIMSIRPAYASSVALYFCLRFYSCLDWNSEYSPQAIRPFSEMVLRIALQFEYKTFLSVIRYVSLSRSNSSVTIVIVGYSVI